MCARRWSGGNRIGKASSQLRKMLKSKASHSQRRSISIIQSSSNYVIIQLLVPAILFVLLRSRMPVSVVK